MSALSRCWLLLLLVFLATSYRVQAQIAVTAGPDSSQVAEPRKETAADSARKTEVLFGRRVTRPTKAAFFAIIPGGGQVYNKRYWKVPLAVGLIGGTIAAEVFYQTRYRKYVTQYNFLADSGIAALPRSPYYNKLTAGNTVEGSQRGIVFYRRWRDQFIAYSAVAYGLTMLDALVDAHLRDFDISDDLSLHIEPAMLRTPMVAAAPGVSLTFSLTSTRSSSRK